MLINLNGELLPADQPIFTADNRSFRYGDGLFETIRVFNGSMPFLPRHWHRLMLGFDKLEFEKPEDFTQQFIQDQINRLTNGIGNWRIRLTVWRAGGGQYTPESNQIHYLITASELESDQFELNKTGLVVGIVQNFRLPLPTTKPSILQPFKTTASLVYVLACLFKQEKNLDDCLLLNTRERLACGSSSNIYLVKDNELFTPPTPEGCLKGTMRGAVLAAAKRLNLKVHTMPVTLDLMKEADEVLLTNAIQGIRWVWQVEGYPNHYGYSCAMDLVDELNKMVGESQ
jgi:branched-chain amino acid aminotransferase